MGRNGTDMGDLSYDPIVLRRYLLGTLEDLEKVRAIEQRLMEDESFVDILDLAESELIEEYLDGGLAADETAKFQGYFLASGRRADQLKLIEFLRAAAKAKPQSERSGWFRSVFVPRLVPIAGAAVLLAAVGFIVFWFATANSDIDPGLAELRAAYSGRRPIQSRVTVLPDHVRFAERRGSADNPPDRIALDRAQLYLIEATRKSQSAEAFQALGAFYLLSRDLGQAENALSRAAEIDPGSAGIRSDLGAIHLEAAKDLITRGEGGKALPRLNEALKNIGAAIAADPELKEARFNRALCYELLSDDEQARAAWRDYLKLDPHSEWATEAKENLNRLESRGAVQRSPAELEADFLAAFRQGDERVASQLISDNRELITDKYIPHRLANSIVKAHPSDRPELLRALQFSGRLESNATKDPFAADLAAYYAKVPEADVAVLKRAHERIREGSQACLSLRYADAVELFKSAQVDFEAAGNPLEANLAQYFVSYALANSRRNDDALEGFQSVAAFAARSSYSWLEATATHWVANSHVIARRPSDARRAYEHALELAKAMGDVYAIHRNTVQLAELHSNCGQTSEALSYLAAALFRMPPSLPVRQRYRTVSIGHTVLAHTRLLSASRAAAAESVLIADATGDDMFESQSRSFAGVASAALGDLREARSWLLAGRERASAISDQQTREKLVAFSDLKLGSLALAERNDDDAVERFTAAAAYYDNVELPLNREEAHVGLLQAYVQRGDLETLEREIPKNIQLVEEYRSRLNESDQRIGYFGMREGVYDLAARFEHSRGSYEAAYNFTEMSNSRDLLESISAEGGGEAGPANRYGPMTLREIRDRMPPEVQLVQYSVWEDDLAIWMISRDSFDVVTVPVRAADLEGDISEFLRSLNSEHNDDRVVRLGRSLHDRLIGPIRSRLDPARPICIVPSKVLFGLPFGALVADDGKWLVSQFTISHAPGASVFVRLSEKAARRAGTDDESLLAVGDPTFDPRAFPGLASLKDAVAEVDRIRRLYNRSDPLLRSDATKAAFLKHLPNANVIHFAGHYVPVPGFPDESYLVMAQGAGDAGESLLTSRDLANIKLPLAKLIFLAACRTGADAYIPGEGSVGIARTFLAADVPVVVASHWEVDSRATAELMQRTHQYRREQGLSTAAALRQAQLDLIEGAGGPFTRPQFWAGFAVFGGQAKF